MKKILSGILIVCLMFLSTFSVRAETYLTTIQIRAGLNLSLNGQLVAPVDVNGNRIPVFLHNSTTYVPIRFISQFYGMKVEWDSKTASVYLQSNDSPPFEAQKAPLITQTKVGNIRVRAGINLNLDGKSVQPTNVHGEPITCFLYGSTTFVPVRFISEFYNFKVKWDPDTATVFINNPNDNSNESVGSKSVNLLTMNPSVARNVTFGEEQVGNSIIQVANLRNGSELSYKLNKNYKNLSLEVNLYKEEYVPTYKYKLNIFGDGYLLESIVIDKASLSQFIDLGLNAIKVLEFCFQTSSGVAFLKISNAFLEE